MKNLIFVFLFISTTVFATNNNSGCVGNCQQPGVVGSNEIVVSPNINVQPVNNVNPVTTDINNIHVKPITTDINNIHVKPITTDINSINPVTTNSVSNNQEQSIANSGNSQQEQSISDSGNSSSMAIQGQTVRDSGNSSSIQGQTAHNAGNAQNISIYNPRPHKIVPSMANFVPMPTSPCMATIGGAGAGAGFGFSISGSYINTNCEIQEAAKTMLMIGQYEAAVEIACTGKHAGAASICKEINQVQIKSNTAVDQTTIIIRDNTSAAKAWTGFSTTIN